MRVEQSAPSSSIIPRLRKGPPPPALGEGHLGRNQRKGGAFLSSEPTAQVGGPEVEGAAETLGGFSKGRGKAEPGSAEDPRPLG